MKSRPSTSSAYQTRNNSSTDRKSRKSKEPPKSTKERDNRNQSPKSRDRGTLFEFFDSNINKQIYHPETKHEPEPPRSHDRTKIVAAVRNGHLQVDEKLLKQQCSRQFTDRWFYYSTNKVHAERVSRTVILFDDSDYTMDKFRIQRPKFEEHVKEFVSPHPIDVNKTRPNSAPPCLSSKCYAQRNNKNDLMENNVALFLRYSIYLFSYSAFRV